MAKAAPPKQTAKSPETKSPKAGSPETKSPKAGSRETKAKKTKAGAPDAVDTAPRYQLHRRYLKDSSFENPGAPGNVLHTNPTINLGVQITAQQSNDLYEIALDYRVTATHEQRISFQIELCFAGLFEISKATREQLSRFIYVEAPHILFPHAAKIAADLARDGGLHDLEIAAPDFMTIWKARGTGLLDPTLTLPETTYAAVFANNS